MIRIIVQSCDAGMACNVGGSVLTTYKTFDVDLPEVEKFLAQKEMYVQKQISGFEVLP